MTYRNEPAAPVRHPGALYTAQLANPKQTPWQQSQSHTHGSPKAAHLCVELMCWAAAPRRLEARGRTAAWLCVPLVLEPIDETVSAGCAPPGSANVDEATADPQTTRHGAAAKIAATTLSFIVRAVRWLLAAQPYASLSRSSPICGVQSGRLAKVGGATTLSTASLCLALPQFAGFRHASPFVASAGSILAGAPAARRRMAAPAEPGSVSWRQQ